ncbi:outer membrane protein [Dysgonomonadaceae bacterium PH5-43]|nr:outer membrane protein [Dysgonomonadaceae bacterium PH5-43]
MKKIVLSLFLGFTVLLASAQTTPVAENATGVIRFSLNECLEYAFGNNFTRKNMLLNETVKQEVYDQSKLERLPNVNASLSENWRHSDDAGSSLGGSYGISAGVTLYQGGAITNTIEENKLQMEQTQLQTKQYENDLVINILESFLTVLGNEELLKYQHTLLTASEEQVAQGKAQYMADEILESDYLMLEAQYASDKANIIDTEIARDNSLLNLKSLLSMDPEVDLRIIYPDTAILQQMTLIPLRETVIERAIETWPDLKISQYDVDIANVNVKIAKASYFPTVSLSGSVNSGHNKNFQNFGNQLKNNLNEQIGLSVSVPIWDRGRTKLQTTQSKIALQQAENNKQQTELEIRQQITQQHLNVTSALNKYNTNEIKHKAYSQTFDVYRALFNAGSITAVDLLQQQNNYISALTDYVQSKYNFILRRKILDVYMGIDVTM